jgi:1-acyl-sn-glycerol-3-phosphate acyltransferase
MRLLLPPLRLSAMLLIIFVFFVIWGLGLPFVAASPRLWARWRAWTLRTISRCLLAVMGARVECTGRPPQAPFLLVSNHLSYVDILLLASRLDAVFVSKQEVASWPLLGPLCRAMGTVFINRELRRDISRVLEEMDAKLDCDVGVVLFPEGTSTNGSEVLRFLPPLLELAVRLGRPVEFASLHYSTREGQPPASDVVCWWGGTPFVSHFLRLLSLTSFRAELAFGAQPIVSTDRKQLAAELHRAVAGQLSLA